MRVLTISLGDRTVIEVNTSVRLHIHFHVYTEKRKNLGLLYTRQQWGETLKITQNILKFSCLISGQMKLYGTLMLPEI